MIGVLSNDDRNAMLQSLSWLPISFQVWFEVLALEFLLASFLKMWVPNSHEGLGAPQQGGFSGSLWAVQHRSAFCGSLKIL